MVATSTSTFTSTSPTSTRHSSTNDDRVMSTSPSRTGLHLSTLLLKAIGKVRDSNQTRKSTKTKSENTCPSSRSRNASTARRRRRHTRHTFSLSPHASPIASPTAEISITFPVGLEDDDFGESNWAAWIVDREGKPQGFGAPLDRCEARRVDDVEVDSGYVADIESIKESKQKHENEDRKVSG
ncbi:hypothetical protein T439DRAFT_324041 [Meredithblackwellia eburnea MCA 4105]